MDTPENSIRVFEIVIVQLLEWLGVEWSDMQIRETAELLSSEYHWMSLAEIKGFTAKIKAGHFGKEWGKLRPMSLMGWMLDWSGDVLAARRGKIGQARPTVTPIEEEPEGVRDYTEELKAVALQLQSEVTDESETEEAKAERQRQNDVQQERLFNYAINLIASRLAANETLHNEKEQAFYQENKDVIDQISATIRKAKNR